MNLFLELLATFAISFVLTWYIRIIAIRKSILDIPNERSSHTIPTPKGGGLAVAISWFIGISWLFYAGEITIYIYLALLSGLPLVIIGFLDDIFDIPPGIRSIVQVFSAITALWFVKGIDSVHFGLLVLNLSLVINILAVIFIVWYINLFNFLDGIDGYIGLETIFVGLASILLFHNIAGLFLAVAVFGFLLWNWPRAKIFMGDVGSTLIGFTFAILTIQSEKIQPASLVSWLILTSVFWFDATFTLYRRIKNREKLSQAHRNHAYQRIVRAGWSHQKTDLTALGLNIIGFGLAYLCIKFPLYSLLFLFINIILLFYVNSLIDKRLPFPYKTLHTSSSQKM